MQRINLYPPEMRPKNDLVTARNSVIAFVALFAFLLVTTLMDIARNTKLENHVVALEEKSKELKTNIDQIKNTPKPQKNALFDQKLVHAKAELENRKGLLDVVNSESFGNKTGFSAHFIALAENTPEQLSLNSFALRSGGAYVRLNGESQKPEYVPVLVKKLKETAAFSQSNFGQASLIRNIGKVDFMFAGGETLSEDALIELVEHRQK